MAVLFITHDMGVVAEIADRVVVMVGGEKVEDGTATHGSSTRRGTRIRKRLLAAVPTLGSMRGTDAPAHFALRRPDAGAPAAAPPATVHVPPSGSRAPLLRVRGLKTRFPVRAGILGRVRRRVHAVEQVSFDLYAGRDAGPGRRIRLRQIDDRPLAAAPGRHRRRQHRARRTRDRAARRPTSFARCGATSRWCSRIRSPRSTRD